MGTMIAVVAAGCGSTRTTAAVGAHPHKTSASPAVKVGTVTISGKKTHVLENSKGFTLYYYTKDTPTHSACEASATCAKVWLAAKAHKVPVVDNVHGTFSLLKGQIEYQGHPLYTYSGDSGPGQAHGDGLLGEWWVATPSLKAASSSQSSSSSSTSSSSSSSSSSSYGGY
jgi:predicted lipoprotein with Yx(FWY)xxD motif